MLVRIGLFVMLMAIVGAVVFLPVSPLSAQESGGIGQPASALKWVDHFVVKGGWITWFVLIPLSVATVALAVEHSVSIRRSTILPSEAERELVGMLEERRYADAVRYSSEDPSTLAHVVNAGLLEAGRGFAAMERALEETLEERTARLMRKIEYLNVIGNVSPMIGLFGTVYGMIRLFASIRAAGAIPEPAVIADDISIALVTTFWGLAVAIPALSVFALFRNRIDVLMAEVALTCEKLLDVFKPGAEALAAIASSSPRPPSAGEA